MDLKRQLTSGVLYTAIAKYAGIVVTLVVSAVLARLFTPEQFGIVNIATVFIAFFAVFADMGLGPAVIQRRDLDESDLRGVFSLTFWAAAVLSILFAGLSFVIVRFYDSGPELLHVLLILSVNLFFNTLNMVPNALIMKAQRFKFAAMRSLAVQIVCGAVAIVAALLGMGIYALTINPVLSSIALFAINFSQHPLKPRLQPGRQTVSKVIGFSSFQLGFQIVNYFSRNLDKLLMGRYLSMTELGYYDKSYRLMMMPLQNISFVISPVMHPVLAQIQDDKEHIARAYVKVTRLLAYIGAGLTSAMFFLADDLTLFLFGPQWEASVPCLRILSLSIFVQIISSSSGAVFQAAGDTRRLFGCGIFSAVTCVAAVLVGIFAYGTAEAVAWCLCVAYAVNFVQCYWSLLRGCLKNGWKEFWMALLKPLLMCLVMSAVLWASTRLVCTPRHILNLLIYGAIAVATAAAFVQLSGEYDIAGWIRRKLSA